MNKKELRVVSLSFGLGGGHLFRAHALFRQLKDKVPAMRFYVFTDNPMDTRAFPEGMEFYHLPWEYEKIYRDDRRTALYQHLKHFDPDLILSDHTWLFIRPFLHDFAAKKVIFFRYIHNEFFHVPSVDGLIHHFDPSEFDLCLTMESGFSVEGCTAVPPVTNVFPKYRREDSIIREVLKVPQDKKLAVIAHNGEEGEMENIASELNIDPGEYCLRRLSTFDIDVSHNLFPLADYLGGADLAVGGCGYNFFYETKELGIETVYQPQPRKNNEQQWRYENNLDYQGPYNGADLMTDMILDLF